MTTPLLHLDHVTTVHAGTDARAIHLVVAARARHGIVSANPATVAELAGLICGTTAPHCGIIRFAGHPVTRVGPARRARLGLIAVTARPRLSAALTVGQQLDLAAKRHTPHLRAANSPRVTACRSDRVQEALSRTGLTDYANWPARQLPADRRRLLGLAIALAAAPRLLLLEQLADGLTPTDTQQLATAVRKAADGIAVLAVDTDAHFIAEVADTITHLPARLPAPTLSNTARTRPRPPQPRPPAGNAHDPAPLLTLYVADGTEPRLAVDIRRCGVHTLPPEGCTATALLDMISGTQPRPGQLQVRVNGSPVTGVFPPPWLSVATVQPMNLARTIGEHLTAAAQTPRTGGGHPWTISDVLGMFPRLNTAGTRTPGRVTELDRRALGIGVALLTHPHLLVLNQPTAGLNPPEQNFLTTAINRIGEHLAVLIGTTNSTNTAATMRGRR